MAHSMVGLFYTDRRAMGHLVEVPYQLLGDWMLAWRLVCGLSFFWIFRSLWPERKHLSTLAAILLIVYPAFLSQPDALTKVNHLTGYGLALASMALMLAALRHKHKGISYAFEAAGLLFGSAYVWIYEYMIGLEGMRLALLVLLLYKLGVRGLWPLIKAVIRCYGPYVVPLAGFLYWRLFIFTSVRPTTNVESLVRSYQSNPWFMGLRVVVQTMLDFLSVTVFAWFVKLYQYLSRADFGQIGLALVLAAAGIAIAVYYRRITGQCRGICFGER